MNRDEIKKTLRLYRPDGPDGLDPEITEALALARQDPELVEWLEAQGRLQEVVRQKMQRISPPTGLQARILAEHRARQKMIYWQPVKYALAAAAMVAILIGLPFWLRPQIPAGTGFANYQTEMTAVTLRGYAMEMTTNNPAAIRNYLNQHQAPDNYALPVGLQSADVAGCAIENWQGRKVAMVCFRTGRPLPAGAESDLWLFVIDQAAVAGAPATSTPRLAKINRLTLATWTQGGKLYLLGTTASEAALRKFL